MDKHGDSQRAGMMVDAVYFFLSPVIFIALRESLLCEPRYQGSVSESDVQVTVKDHCTSQYYLVLGMTEINHRSDAYIVLWETKSSMLPEAYLGWWLRTLSHRPA